MSTWPISCKHICTVLFALFAVLVVCLRKENINLLVWARRSDVFFPSVYKHVWKLWLIGITSKRSLIFNNIRFHFLLLRTVRLLSRDMSSRKVITSARNLWHYSAIQTIHPVGIQKPESQNGRRSHPTVQCGHAFIMRAIFWWPSLPQSKAFRVKESIYKCACFVRLLYSPICLDSLEHTTFYFQERISPNSIGVL